jgi:translation initiation factor IF-1
VGFDPAVKKGAGGPGAAVTAVVVSELPNAVFEVVLDTRQKVRAHLVSEGQKNFVRLVPGDRVEVELSPHDPTRGRIQRKL